MVFMFLVGKYYCLFYCDEERERSEDVAIGMREIDIRQTDTNICACL